MDSAYQTEALSVLRSEGIVAVADQFEVARYLSKLGTLDADEEMLRFIAPLLSSSDVLALHAYFCHFRHEFEWRAQFASIFAEHADALP